MASKLARLVAASGLSEADYVRMLIRRYGNQSRAAMKVKVSQATLSRAYKRVKQ